MQYNDFSGLILVNKPAGITSFKLVYIIRKKLKVKKAGHCGTLDPLASGLMIVLVGKYTKIQDKFMKQDKVYSATIKLGLKTDSGDLDGKIISQSDFSHITKDLIIQTCKQFVGKISQVPPMYSALKVNGQKLYELARKGITIERKPREITIYDIDLTDYQKDNFSIRVKCSSGTYIRTLAEDIGTKLNTDTVLINLVREEIGNYKLTDAINIDDIKDNDDSCLLKVDF
ncbi:MAG: tRNA pseudouridine(55) synthase TruB [Endomicrobiaceae bacterium]|nr:tRNA pseudouridine(55) synthase TruB [Endomicrobiaceae bacterium]